MNSPSAVRGIASEFRPELTWLCGMVDEALRDSTKLFAPRGRVPRGHVISMLTREALGPLVGSGSPVRPGESWPRLVVESYGQDWIKVSLKDVGTVRLRKRPGKTSVGQPPLEAADEAVPALFDAPAGGVLVMFWDWSATTGMLRALWLSDVATLEWGSKGPTIFDEVKFELVASAVSVPTGAGRAEDDLADLVSRWDQGGTLDEPGDLQSFGTDQDEDEHDEGDSAVGDAG